MCLLGGRHRRRSAGTIRRAMCDAIEAGDVLICAAVDGQVDVLDATKASV